MIDINKLDQSKTYVGWNIGVGFISSKIQDCSAKESKFPIRQIATHVYAIIFENSKAFVIEAHANWNGVKKLPFEEWIKYYDLKSIFAYPYKLDTTRLQYYVDFNPGYSMADIGTFAIESFTGIHIFNNNPGVSCSELIANCDVNYNICYKYKLPAYRIKPAHFQNELEVQL